MKNLYESLQKETLALSIINGMPSIFYIQRQDGKLVFWNKILEDLTGYTYDEINGSHYSIFYQEKDEEKITKLNDMAFNYGYSEGEVEFKLKNDKIRNVYITGSRFEYENVTYIIGVILDISVRVKAENDLKIALNEISSLKVELQKENIYLKEEIDSNFKFEEIISQSSNIKKLFGKISQVAQTEASILVYGETGTGKELISRAIHRLSNRNHKSIIKINCASIPATLLESELFGHEKGAFTGAVKMKLGRFEIANEGTLFLDEIGELPMELQPKLLRVLQDGEFERLGGTKTIKVNVRIISATNRNLEEEVEKGNFRSDLYFRLNVFPIFVPPLRDRKEDIPLLVEHFLKKFNIQHNKKIDRVPKRIYNKFERYNWPGNIRELQNILERAVILTSGNTLILDELLLQSANQKQKDSDFLPIAEYEKEYIIKVLESTYWRIRGEKGAAKILKLKPTTLESRMKKLGITRG